jgi:ATP adenylyltransferase
MDRLWSPWRMRYIESAKEEPDGTCVFCALLAEPSGEGRLLARTDLAFVTLAKYPYNPGHLLVLPVRHVPDLSDLSDAENVEIGRLMQQGLAALRVESDPHGFNVGLNLGRAAGAGIPEHLHWHVVPRWGGDTNFMPVVGDTRVLPELLQETYERLKPRFEAP